MSDASISVAVVPVTAFQQNCSVLKCTATGKGAVVDPGGDLDEVLAAVDELEVELEKILVTHAHIDHAGAVNELSGRLGLPIEGPHKEDSFWIDMLPQQSMMFGLAPAERFEPTRWLEGGDTVTVGELVLDVVHCPGHTPGHVVFFSAPEKMAFVGDVIFQRGIGRTDFPKGDHATLIASITERLFPLGDDVTFIPGHGPPSTFGDERRHNPFLQG